MIIYIIIIIKYKYLQDCKFGNICRKYIELSIFWTLILLWRFTSRKYREISDEATI